MPGPLLHVDADAFFASVAMRGRPWLAGQPVVVGEVVVACASYPARRLGLRAGMSLLAARRVCPDVVVLPVPGDAVQAVSEALFVLLEELVPAVEPGSMEEAFLDTTALTWSGAQALGRDVRRRVRDELGIGVSVGVGRTKLIAKTASRAAKPDGLVVIPPAGERAIRQQTPVRELWGVGERTADRLAAVGVETLAGLAQLSTAQLHELCGTTMARRLRAMAQGTDDAGVRPVRARRSFSAETATAGWGRPDRGVEELADIVVERVCRRSELARRSAGTVAVVLRRDDGGQLVRRLRLGEASHDVVVVREAVAELLARAPVPPVGVLGVTLSDLVDVDQAQQSALF